MVKYKRVISSFAASILVTSRVIAKSVKDFVLDVEDVEKRKDLLNSIEYLQKRVSNNIEKLEEEEHRDYMEMDYLADMINSLKTDMELLKSIDISVQELYKKIESRVEEGKSELEALIKEVDDLASSVQKRRDGKTS